MKAPTLALLLAALPVPALAQEAGNEVPASLGLTIYSSADPAGFDPQQFIAQQRQGYNPMFAWQVPGFGVVRETRSIALEQGVNTVNFVDVARFIDPTTVSFVDLENPEQTSVLEQTFLFDLVSPDKLLEKYVDQQITVRVPTQTSVEEMTGKLLSYNQGQLVLQTDGGLRLVPYHGSQVQLGAMPGGMITKPTLQWLVSSQAADEARRVRTSYQTNGITWKADYNLILNESDTKADLAAWVTILNLSGKAYPDTQLKLIAGDVQRIQPPQPMADMMYRARGAVAMAAEAAPGFEEKTFFEYHLYTLPRPTTVADNTTQQITLFPTATGANVEKVLVYYGTPDAQHWGIFPEPQLDRAFGNQSNKKIDVYIRFENREENQLGMPLPRGKVRVFKLDTPDGGDASQGTLEFVGEDLIDHTPRNEKVLIKIGQAFDVVGERTQTDYRIDTGRKTLSESFKIQIRNHKKEAVKVVVKENLYRWLQWEITEHSDPFEKVDARTAHFEVEVPADGVKDVTYTVKYSW